VRIKWLPSPLEGEGLGERGKLFCNAKSALQSKLPPLPNPLPPGERE
jgi:hypothetical protein